MRKSIDFDWVPNSENAARMMYDRLVGATSVVAAFGLVSLLVFGGISRQQAAGDALFAVFLLAVSLFVLRSISRAHVVIDDEKLSFHNAGGAYEYPWADVRSFSRRPPKAGRIFRFLRIQDTAFIEIHLTRRSRLGLWRASGTRAVGIPQPVKRLELRVRDLDRLAAEIEKRAGPSS